MPFNSLEFLFFLVPLLLMFQAVRKYILLTQVLLTLGSFLFYMIGDAHFFPFLLGLGITNYFFAKAIVSSTSQKKTLLILILILDIAFLVGSKMIGQNSKHFPIGVSFFTFQVMSFIIDTYRAKIPLPQGMWHFFSYMFFFPHLIAGPICRASGLMKQLSKPLAISNSSQIRSGLYLISFGLLKKAVLADSLAIRIDEIFLYPTGTQGIVAWLIVIGAYGWQIYFDFSGYTDMARGLGKLFGLELPLNFFFPYFSRSLSEFWQRWHISLSQWFKDYVYIPLGGSREGGMIHISAILITFLLSSLWHGIGWNYVIWGMWHATWLIISVFCFKKQSSFLEHMMTVVVVFFGWLFFRCQDVEQIKKIFDLMSTTSDQSFWMTLVRFKSLLWLSGLCLLADLSAQRFKKSYLSMQSFKADAVWVAVTLFAFLFQAPLKDFIYARF
jgi:alginate O-acetyltransferase complex protein AlgI